MPTEYFWDAMASGVRDFLLLLGIAAIVFAARVTKKKPKVKKDYTWPLNDDDGCPPPPDTDQST